MGVSKTSVRANTQADWSFSCCCVKFHQAQSTLIRSIYITDSKALQLFSPPQTVSKKKKRLVKQRDKKFWKA